MSPKDNKPWGEVQKWLGYFCYEVIFVIRVQDRTASIFGVEVGISRYITSRRNDHHDRLISSLHLYVFSSE